MAGVEMTGQTGADSAKIDYSPLSMLDALDEVVVNIPQSCIKCLWDVFCCLCKVAEAFGIGCDAQEICEPCCDLKDLFCPCLGITLKKEVHVFGIGGDVDDDKQKSRMVPLFDLRESSSCCARQCCGGKRPYTLNAVQPEADKNEEPLFQIQRAFRCGFCCCSSTGCMGRDYMEVIVSGVVIGYVMRMCRCSCMEQYDVYDANDSLLVKIEKRTCFCDCCDQSSYKILTPDGKKTGKLITDEIKVEFPDFMNTISKKLLLIAVATMAFSESEKLEL